MSEIVALTITGLMNNDRYRENYRISEQVHYIVNYKSISGRLQIQG